MQKLWQPNRVDHAHRMMMSSWSADRNCERTAVLCTGVYTSPWQMYIMVFLNW